MTYFEFYGLKPFLVSDKGLLKKKFLEKSRRYHPDHFVLKTAQEKDEAEEYSALNNKAFKTLSDPDLRIKYILELKGLIQDEDVKSLGPNFLMEMMEINELITDNPELAEKRLTDTEKGLQKTIESLSLSFDFDSIHPEDLAALRDYYYKRRYVLRLREILNKFATEQRL